MTTVLERKIAAGTDFIRWNSSYLVGISDLDQQHQKLIAIINELHQSLLREPGDARLQEVLDRLIEHSRWHFGEEENLFIRYGYPWSATHKAEHQVFIRTLTTFVQKFRQGNLEISDKHLTFLRDWLINHIISKDKTYSYFLIGKGLS